MAIENQQPNLAFSVNVGLHFVQHQPTCVSPTYEIRYLAQHTGYWEHLIRDDKDLQAHVDYIHFNPVKHGYCAKPIDWPYSSIHRHIAAGWIGANLAVDSGSGRE